MHHRSWLFVPGDSEKKLGLAAGAGADAVVLDLADAVAVARKETARGMVREWLKAHRTQIVENRKLARWVRISPLEARQWRDDLIAVMPGAPDGIVLPRATGAEAVQQLGAEIYEHEQRNGVTSGSTRIIAAVSSSPQGALAIGSYIEAPLPRLAGISWNAEELAAAIGARRVRDATGQWTDVLRMVRAQVLLAAHARGIVAIETPWMDPTDPAGLEQAAQDARADGFSGMPAIHPNQVAAINAVFAPSDAELAEARAILAALEPATGTAQLAFDRRTIDPAQVRMARRLLGVEV